MGSDGCWAKAPASTRHSRQTHATLNRPVVQGVEGAREVDGGERGQVYPSHHHHSSTLQMDRVHAVQGQTGARARGERGERGQVYPSAAAASPTYHLQEREVPEPQEAHRVVPQLDGLQRGQP